MTTHTPGPWFIINHNWSDTSIVHQDTDKTVCKLTIYEEDTDDTPEALESERNANARLIAAAPEMLEVLKECVTAWRNIHAPECYRSGHIPCQCTPCKVKRIIAQAECHA